MYLPLKGQFRVSLVSRNPNNDAHVRWIILFWFPDPIPRVRERDRGQKSITPGPLHNRIGSLHNRTARPLSWCITSQPVAQLLLSSFQSLATSAQIVGAWPMLQPCYATGCPVIRYATGHPVMHPAGQGLGIRAEHYTLHSGTLCWQVSRRRRLTMAATDQQQSKKLMLEVSIIWGYG